MPETLRRQNLVPFAAVRVLRPVIVGVRVAFDFGCTNHMRPVAAVRILRPVIVGVGVAFDLDCAH